MPRTLSPVLLLLLATGCSSVLGERNPEAAGQAAAREPYLPVVFGETTAPPRDAARGAAEPVADPDGWRRARGTILRTFAFRALEQGLLEEARNYLVEACETNPADAASHAALARLYLAEEDVEAALAYAREAAAYAPEDPEVAVVLAAALAESNQEEAATEILERTWQVSAADSSFARALLTHYAASGRDDLARQLVQRLLDEAPGDASSWTLAGDLFLAEGDLEKATEAYRKAVAIDPDVSLPESIAGRLGLGGAEDDPVLAAAEAAEEQGDPVAAERLYRFLAESKPEVPGVQAGLARVLLAQGRIEEAETALARLPLDRRGWREHLLQARLDILGRRWEDARASLHLARVARPGLRPAALLMNFVEEHLRQPEEDGGPAGGETAGAPGDPGTAGPAPAAAGEPTG